MDKKTCKSGIRPDQLMKALADGTAKFHAKLSPGVSADKVTPDVVARIVVANAARVNDPEFHIDVCQLFDETFQAIRTEHEGAKHRVASNPHA